MRTILALVAVVSFWSTALGQEDSPMAVTVRDADVVAIVSVTNVIRGVSTNVGRGEFAVFTADVSIERVFKGKAPQTIRILDEGDASLFSYDNFFERPFLKSNTKSLGTSRFLVFLKSTGDTYVVSHRYGLAPIYGIGPEARVTLRSCRSIEEVTAWVEAALRKK